MGFKIVPKLIHFTIYQKNEILKLGVRVALFTGVLKTNEPRSLSGNGALV